MNQVVKITGVFENHGENTKGPWTRYDVKTAGGTKFQTFDDTLGATATGLKGQQAEVEYEVQARGQYENNVLKAIRPAGGAVNAPDPAVIATSYVATYGGDDRELRIMRQSGLDRAISTVAAGIVEANGAADLFALSDAYIDYFQNGVKRDDGVKF